MNVQQRFLELTGEMRYKRLQHLKRMRSDRIPGIILELDVEGRRGKEKTKDQLMNVVRRSIISIIVTEEHEEGRDLWRRRKLLWVEG
jgi:hypothetical protein